MKTKFLIFTIVMSIVLLVPGITKPILSISGSIEKVKLREIGIQLAAESIDASKRTINWLSKATDFLVDDKLTGSVEVFQKTRSIVDTVKELYHAGYPIISVLIVTFSIVVPTIKLLMQLTLLSPLNTLYKKRLELISSVMSKWSMADVFVMSLIITFMALEASSGNDSLISTKAHFCSGFYFFLGYCLFSVLSSCIMMFINTPAENKIAIESADAK